MLHHYASVNPLILGEICKCKRLLNTICRVQVTTFSSATPLPFSRTAMNLKAYPNSGELKDFLKLCEPRLPGYISRKKSMVQINMTIFLFTAQGIEPCNYAKGQ